MSLNSIPIFLLLNLMGCGESDLKNFEWVGYLKNMSNTNLILKNCAGTKSIYWIWIFIPITIIQNSFYCETKMVS